MMSLLRTIGSALVVLALCTNVQAQVLTPTVNTTRYTVAIADAPALVNIPTILNVTDVDDTVVYVPLPFQFVFWNRTYSSVNVSSNGNIQFQTASTSSTNALFATTTAATFTPAIAFYLVDLVPGSGNPIKYGIVGTAPNRQFVLRLTNIRLYQAATNSTGLTCDILLYEGTNVIEMRYYALPTPETTLTSRKVEIGIQDASNSILTGVGQEFIYFWNDEVINTTATAALFTNKQVRFTPVNSVAPGTPVPPVACNIPPTYTPGRSYDIQLTAAPAFAAIPGLNITRVEDDIVDSVPIGFPFVFYNQTWTTVNLSTNGNMQFNTSVTSAGAAFFASTTSTYAPAIAFFHSDMKPSTPEQRTFITTGTPPNRRFIVRYDDVNYCCAAYVAGAGVQLDVILHETSNLIDMVYYRVPTGTRNVEIGLQNSGVNDWVAVWNDRAFTAGTACAANIEGKQIRYIPINQAGSVTPSTGAPATSSTGAAASSSTAAASSTATPVASSSTARASSSTAPAASSTAPAASSTAPAASSTAPATSSTAAPQPSSSSAVLPIDSSSAIIELPSSTAEESQNPEEDPNLNGSASINAMVAFVVIAISMIAAL